MAEEKAFEKKVLTIEEQKIKNDEWKARRNEIQAKRLEISRDVLNEIESRIRKGEDVIIPASMFNNGKFVFRKENIDSPENFRTKVLLEFLRYFENALKVINNNRINSADLDIMKVIEDKFNGIIVELDNFAEEIHDMFKDRTFASKLAYKQNALIKIIKQDAKEPATPKKNKKDKEAEIEGV